MLTKKLKKKMTDRICDGDASVAPRLDEDLNGDATHFEGEDAAVDDLVAGQGRRRVVGQVAVDEDRSVLGVVEEGGHLVGQAAQNVAARLPAQHQQAQNELQRQAPRHLAPPHLTGRTSPIKTHQNPSKPSPTQSNSVKHTKNGRAGGPIEDDSYQR